MKKLFVTYFAVMLTALAFNSCSSDDDSTSGGPVIPKTLTDSICGSWYSQNPFGYAEETINKDGSYNLWVTLFVEGFSLNEHNKGTWKLEDNAIATTYMSETFGQLNESCKLKKVTDYNIVEESGTDGSTTTLSRIVSEVTVKAGETLKLEMPETYNKLVPVKYESDYMWVASVDDSGNVIGKERGMTYVIASDNSGNSVVFKVNVTSDQTLPDYTSYIGKSVDDFTKDFDKNIGYFEIKGYGRWDMYSIALRDDIISEIGFTSPNGKDEIDMISFDLTENADFDTINKEFASKYTKIEDSNGNYYFDGDINTAQYKILVNATSRTVTITANNQKDDDSLVPDYSGIDQMNVSQFLDKFNLTIDEDEIDPDDDVQLVYIYPSNPSVSYGFLSYSLSTGVISSVSLYMNQDVTNEDEVKQYLESVYHKEVVGTNEYYCSGNSLLESHVWISCKTNSRGKLVVSFMAI